MSVRHRRVSPLMWDDEWFVDQDDFMRNLWQLILTGPQVLPIPGLQLTGPGSLAETLRRDPGTVSERFGELLANGSVKYDPKHRLLCVVNAPKHNPPDNPNQVRGWWNTWRSLPDSHLKYEHIQALREVVFAVEGKASVGLRAAWQETFGTVPEPFPNRSETVTQTVREQRVGSRELGIGNSDLNQYGASAPPVATAPAATVPELKLVPTEPKQQKLPLPKPKKPTDIGALFGVWGECYKAKYGVTYQGDRKRDLGKVKELLAQSAELAAQLAPHEPDGQEKCLRHWFEEYLNDQTQYFCDERHPLRLIGQRLNTYGNYWEKLEGDDDWEWREHPPAPKDPPGTKYCGPTPEFKATLESLCKSQGAK